MQAQTTSAAPRLVDPQELDRRVVEWYRDVAHEAARDLHFPTGWQIAEALGYPADLLHRCPAQAVNSFAGVGYHLGLARLLPGERVLDLGSGSGMEVFAVAIQVGPRGSVTGVDVTPEQLAKAERLRPSNTPCAVPTRTFWNAPTLAASSPLARLGGRLMLTSKPEPRRRAALLGLRTPPLRDGAGQRYCRR